MLFEAKENEEGAKGNVYCADRGGTVCLRKDPGSRGCEGTLFMLLLGQILTGRGNGYAD